jgi:hypothetical protein
VGQSRERDEAAPHGTVPQNPPKKLGESWRSWRLGGKNNGSAERSFQTLQHVTGTVSRLFFPPEALACSIALGSLT